MYGYYPNASKTWLLVKPSAQDRARELFGDSGVNITADGRRLLGACLSTETSVHQYVSNAVAGFVQQVELLSKVAITEPHAAFAAFTHAVMASPEDGSSYRAIIRYRLVQAPPDGCFFAGFSSSLPHTHNRFVLPTRH